MYPFWYVCSSKPWVRMCSWVQIWQKPCGSSSELPQRRSQTATVSRSTWTGWLPASWSASRRSHSRRYASYFWLRVGAVPSTRNVGSLLMRDQCSLKPRGGW